MVCSLVYKCDRIWPMGEHYRLDLCIFSIDMIFSIWLGDNLR